MMSTTELETLEHRIKLELSRHKALLADLLRDRPRLPSRCDRDMFEPDGGMRLQMDVEGLPFRMYCLGRIYNHIEGWYFHDRPDLTDFFYLVVMYKPGAEEIIDDIERCRDEDRITKA